MRVVVPAAGSGTRGESVTAGPLPLPLRNRLAELILEAFEPGDARATLAALTGACGPDGAAVEAGDAHRLEGLGWFESPAPGRIRLKPAHQTHARALGERAARGVAATAGRRDPDGEALVVLLDRAAALADRGLYFEVHELLEPAWFRAPEPERTALQGLIQVGVAFHHLENENREGARSLLADGVAKLAATDSALPLDTTAWLGELRAGLAELVAGGRPAENPRWPRPSPPASRRTP